MYTKNRINSSSLAFSNHRSLLLPTVPLYLFYYLYLTTHYAAGDFIYYDFNDTIGLVYNGDASTTSCGENEPYLYNSQHHNNDEPDKGSRLPWMEESTDIYTEQTSATFEQQDIEQTTRYISGFPHRDTYKKALDPDGCDLRLRLTPSRPYKVGSVMRLEAAPVLDGFETGFQFQISDHSQFCTMIKDASFSIHSHKVCSIQGGDGFAFVLHADSNSSSALGEGGNGLGYAGIRNAIVVEFDTLYNGGLGSTNKLLDSLNGGEGDADLITDHVSVQASPHYGTDSTTTTGMVTQAIDTRLAALRSIDIADGNIHTVRIIYWPYIRYDLVHLFTATPYAAQFLGDNGDGRRIGTFAVYMDNLKEEEPLIIFPINLNSVLRLLENQAYMGFTASTGNAWEKHDILEVSIYRYYR